jgi:hypothetical protein
VTGTPQVGDVVKDSATNKVGKIMGFVGPYAQLRPLGGGREWDVLPELLSPVDPAEALSACVAETNARSRQGLSVSANSSLPTATRPCVAVSNSASSPECALAKRPGYQDLHAECRQTQDVFLPRAAGILLTPRCGCVCHGITDGSEGG